MADNQLSMSELDRVFARLRASEAAPSDALFARVMNDAIAQMPAAAAQTEQAAGLAVDLAVRGDLAPASHSGSSAGMPAAPRTAAPRTARSRPGVFVSGPPVSGLSRLWAALSAGFGGAGVVASLGAVMMAALFLGYTDPAGLGDNFLPASAAEDGLEIEPVAIYFLAGG
ncbi:hypothetical protein HOY34_10805 [Xinfangfangia sp. D13-10-4-6]|uniref:hypothetical protein n=1 Tax=Pseudogemmobacter hezensis TaxID=2737662 RepID=UPI0015563421|nr:hypothetical protein [Pseudogemmobacter hezensis]NPD15691.1 hypothetical protein [Pseudogemmobacter hezensis]